MKFEKGDLVFIIGRSRLRIDLSILSGLAVAIALWGPTGLFLENAKSTDYKQSVDERNELMKFTIEELKEKIDSIRHASSRESLIKSKLDSLPESSLSNRAVSEISIRLAKNDSMFSDLNNRIYIIESAVKKDAKEVLTAVMLQKDLETQSRVFDEKIESLKTELEHAYTIIYGSILALAVGVALLALPNWMNRPKKLPIQNRD